MSQPKIVYVVRFLAVDGLRGQRLLVCSTREVAAHFFALHSGQSIEELTVMDELPPQPAKGGGHT